MKVMTPTERLTKARILLLLDHPFFGTLATRLPNVMDPTIPTACTNGREIRWNPQFINSITDENIRAVYAHEVLHVANGHTWRRGGRDPLGWNIAADKAINPIIKEAGLVLPPAGCLWPEGAECGKAAEAIYSQGQQKPATPQTQRGGKGSRNGKPQAGGQNGAAAPGNGQDGQGDQNGPNMGVGAVDDAPQGDEAAQAADWKVAVAQAAASAKGRGNMPGGLARMVKEIVDPQVPWETILRDFVERSARNDYNWTQPNRRYLSSGFVLPSLISEELPEIVLAVDTSGSVTQEMLNAFSAEANAILGAYETTIRIIYVDTRVAHTETVTRAELPFFLAAKGGGGTDFRPAFAWVEKEALTPACLIYVTDMDGQFPPAAPDYPVLWISTTDAKAPFGDTIKLN